MVKSISANLTARTKSLSFLIANSLRRHDNHIADTFIDVLDLRQETIYHKGLFGDKDNMRRIKFIAFAQGRRCSQPTGIAPHSLDHLDRVVPGDRDRVQRRVLRGLSNKASGATVARTVIG